MNLSAEKAELIKRFEEIKDTDVIQAIKDLLDFSPTDHEEALETALDKALLQSEKKQVRPHKEVIADIRKRFKE